MTRPARYAALQAASKRAMSAAEYRSETIKIWKLCKPAYYRALTRCRALAKAANRVASLAKKQLTS